MSAGRQEKCAAAVDEDVAMSTVQTGPYWWPMQSLGGKQDVQMKRRARQDRQVNGIQLMKKTRAAVAVGEET